MNDRSRPLVIEHLFRVPRAIDTLVRWFESEWAPHYGPEGPGDARASLEASRSADALPLRLVALAPGGEVLGTVALQVASVESHRHLSPWLASLMVGPAYRRRGVASALIPALEGEARRLGFAHIYTATATAADLVRRRGWRELDRAPTYDGPIPVFALDLEPP